MFGIELIYIYITKNKGLSCCFVAKQ